MERSFFGQMDLEALTHLGQEIHTADSIIWLVGLVNLNGCGGQDSTALRVPLKNASVAVERGLLAEFAKFIVWDTELDETRITLKQQVENNLK